MKILHVITIALLSIAAVNTSAQIPQQVTVIGEASTTVSPTIVKLHLRITSNEDNYASATQSLFTRSGQLANELKTLGFKSDEIITSDLSISKNNRFDNGKQIESYFATQQISVEFKYKEDEIIKVLNKLAVSEAEPDTRFSFDLSETEKEIIKNELLSKAVQDARKTADILAKAADSEIIGISQINYGIFQLPADPQRGAMTMEFSRASMESYNPQDLGLSQQVQVVFILK